MVEPGKPQMAIRRVRIVCWITKATNTHSEYVIHVAFPRQHWVGESVSMLRHGTLPVLYHIKYGDVEIYIFRQNLYVISSRQQSKGMRDLCAIRH